MVMRWVASAAALVMLGIVGLFLIALLNHPSPIPAGKADRLNTEGRWIDRVVGQAGAWIVTAEIEQLASGPVTIGLTFAGDEGELGDPDNPPRALLRMLDMEMGTQPVPLERLATGRWRGASNLSMDGRWNLEVQIDADSASLPFDARSR